jgi:type IV fimbrial biogenesis protein FimT
MGPMNSTGPIHSMRIARPPRPARGFTLMELIITILVAAILTAIAVPAFDSFVKNDRDSAQVNSLAYSMNYARSEAVKRDLATGVSVCPSLDGLNCNGAAWASGWMVYYVDPTTGANVSLQTVPALAGGNQVTSHGAATTATGITFLSSGMATGLAGPMAAPLQINVCDTRGAPYARDIEVNVAGRVATSQNHGVAVDGVTPLACP